jgi:hypothetical protein
MNKLLSVALMVIGASLIVYGAIAMDSFSSDLSRLFTGAPTEKSMWMFIGGIILALAGLSGVTFFGSRSNPG